MEDFEFEKLVNENCQRAGEHKEQPGKCDTVQKCRNRKVQTILTGVLNCLCLLCIGVAFLVFAICDWMVIELGLILFTGFIGAACFCAGVLREKVRSL